MRSDQMCTDVQIAVGTQAEVKAFILDVIAVLQN